MDKSRHGGESCRGTRRAPTGLPSQHPNRRLPVSQDALLQIILVTGVSAYLLYLWVGDFRAEIAGRPNPRGFPGATPCPAPIIGLAVAGSLLLLGLETMGENALGLSEKQSNIAVLFLVPMVCAAFYEELIFRGFLVFQGKGRGKLIGGVVVCSAGFALLHSFLWQWKPDDPAAVGGVVFDTSLKAWWSSGMVFLASIWWYAMRLCPLNPRRSLLPCFAGHLAKNLGVFAIKLAQGHVLGWW